MSDRLKCDLTQVIFPCYEYCQGMPLEDYTCTRMYLTSD